MQQTMRAPLRPPILCLTTNSTPRFREVIASIVSVVRNSHKRGRSSFDITATLDGLLSARKSRPISPTKQRLQPRKHSAVLCRCAERHCEISQPRGTRPRLGDALARNAQRGCSLDTRAFSTLEYAFSILLNVDDARRGALDADLSGFLVPAQLVIKSLEGPASTCTRRKLRCPLERVTGIPEADAGVS